MNNTPKYFHTLFLIAVVTISSTTLKSLFISTLPDNSKITELTDIKPIIERYTSVEQVSFNASNMIPITYLKYFFNGILDNGKPTAFSNDYIPQGWYEINQDVIGNWRYLTITNRSKKALIRYTFEINTQKIPTSVAFKKQRLKEALIGNSETYLHWQFLNCLEDCVLEKSTLQQSN